MAASTTDLFTYVGNPGTATTLSAPGYTSGGTSINVGSTTNFPTTTAVVFAIDEVETVGGEEVRTAGTYNAYRGIVASGTSITNVTWLNGDGDRDYAAGSSTRVYITTASAWANRLVDGLSVEHNKDGTHSTITATSINLTGAATTDTVSEKTAANGVTIDGLNIKDGKLNTNNSVVTTNITDANVTTAKIADGAVTPAKRSGGYKVGTFTITATGSKAVTGVGFIPKIVEFEFSQTGSTTRMVKAFGYMDGTTQYASSGVATNTPNAAGAADAAKCLLVTDTTNGVLIGAAYTSFDADGFTINVSTYTNTYGNTFIYRAYA